MARKCLKKLRERDHDQWVVLGAFFRIRMETQMQLALIPEKPLRTGPLGTLNTPLASDRIIQMTPHDPMICPPLSEECELCHMTVVGGFLAGSYACPYCGSISPIPPFVVFKYQSVEQEGAEFTRTRLPWDCDESH